jgi:streptogramin lyase
MYFANLGQIYVTRIDPTSRNATKIDPPTSDQGARRVRGARRR